MLRTLLLFLRLLRLLGDPVTCLDVPCCSHFSDVVLLAFPRGRFPWRCPLARTLFPWPCPIQGPPEAPGPPFALLLLSGGLWGFPETAASAPTRPPFPRADCFARCGPSPGGHRGWGSRCDHSRTPVVPALGSDALSARQSQDRAGKALVLLSVAWRAPYLPGGKKENFTFTSSHLKIQFQVYHRQECGRHNNDTFRRKHRRLS